MRLGPLRVCGIGAVMLVGCDRPAADGSAGVGPKPVIDAAAAARAETEKKLEAQRQAIKASLGETESGGAGQAAPK